MLSRKYRATRLDIEETLKTGSTTMGKFLYAKVSKKDSINASFAIVVSKKNEKTSVGRHLIKRKVSSYIEKNIEKISPEFKRTIVFIMKKTTEPISYIELEKDVDFVIKNTQKSK